MTPYQALYEKAALFSAPMGVLEVSGSDRADFVHNQCTSHIKGLAKDRFVSTLLLNNRGQIEHMASVFNLGDRLWLVASPAEIALIQARFKRFIVFDQVELKELDGLVGLRVQGPQAQTLASAWNPPQEGCQWREGVLLAREDGGVLALLSANDAAAWQAHLNLPQALEQDWVVYSVEQGWPSLTEAKGQLPQEVGLEHKVNYKKGCYLGQEIMARLEARGNTRYQLVGVGGANLQQGAALSQAEKTVGTVGRVVDSPRFGRIGLATLRKDAEPTAIQLQHQSVRVHPLPFV